MEKVVDNDELMERMRVTYVIALKILKLLRRKNAWKEITSALGIDIVSA